jgi:ribose 5-phosphate isomerase
MGKPFAATAAITSLIVGSNRAPQHLSWQGGDHVVGVVEHGFFIGLTSEVHVADGNGVRV